MGQHDRAVGTKQIVEPTIGAAGFDHGVKGAERLYGVANGFRVLALDGDCFHDFARGAHAGDDNGKTMKINAEVPHE